MKENTHEFLDTVVLHDNPECQSCGAPMCPETGAVTVRDVWTQSSAGYDYEDGSEGGALHCGECDG